METLTVREEQTLEAIRTHLEETGYPPTIRELAERLGLASHSTATFHLNGLIAKGRVVKDADKPRALRIIE